MNNTSLVIFDISHVVRNVRDTLEFIVPNKEVSVKTYEARKTVLKSVLEPKTFFGNFLANNQEKLADFKKGYEDYLNEVYGDDSTILVKAANEENIRVDHGQDIAIVKGVIYLGETFRDIMFSHVEQARKQNSIEEAIIKHIDLDERVDRAVKLLVLLQLYEKSFAEFQKVMSESQGKPTPQSNFIVQNELNVLAAMVRFVRDHSRMIDNHTLDAFDKAVELMQMCEGRRERRDNKSFPDLFRETLSGIGAIINEFGPKYDESYSQNLKEMLEQIKKNQANATAKA